MQRARNCSSDKLELPLFIELIAGRTGISVCSLSLITSIYFSNLYFVSVPPLVSPLDLSPVAPLPPGCASAEQPVPSGRMPSSAAHSCPMRTLPKSESGSLLHAVSSLSVSVPPPLCPHTLSKLVKLDPSDLQCLQDQTRPPWECCCSPRTGPALVLY